VGGKGARKQYTTTLCLGAERLKVRIGEQSGFGIVEPCEKLAARGRLRFLRPSMIAMASARCSRREKRALGLRMAVLTSSTIEAVPKA